MYVCVWVTLCNMFICKFVDYNCRTAEYFQMCMYMCVCMCMYVYTCMYVCNEDFKFMYVMKEKMTTQL